MIVLKAPGEIARMRAAGKIVRGALDVAAKLARPGESTLRIDRSVEEYILSHGAIPSFKGYGGFPGSACVSINEEVVHGIPSAQRVLQEGDIVGIDVGAILDGFHGDAAETFPVGLVDAEVQRLLTATAQSLSQGIAAAVVGNRISDISWAVQSYAEERGFSVVESFVGHGIGKEMHEDPPVPNFGKPGRGPKLRAGMTLAIEPMLNMGGYEVYVMPDQWTVRTSDGSLSAHFEHTIAITDEGPEILTL